MKKIVGFGTAHLWETLGKRSPDGRFREAVYSREIIKELRAKFEAYGYQTFVDYEPLEADKRMYSHDQSVLQSRELNRRVEVVNTWCRKYGAENVLFVSLHNDAIGTDGKWHDCGGWSCMTTPGITQSDLLAECLYDAADVCLGGYKTRFVELQKNGVYGKKQRPIRTETSDGDRDFESGLYVLRKTMCPAVLTENLFQDNKSDVEWLLSDEGRHAIMRLHIEGIINFIERY